MEDKNIKVGIGMTLCIRTDRYPYTVIRILDSKKTLILQQDDFKRMSESDYCCQIYKYNQNTENDVIKVELIDDKYYYKKLFNVIVGERSAYIDPSF
jgi:hypothetical protein